MDYTSYKQARQMLGDVVKRQLKIVESSSYDDTAAISPKPSETLVNAIQSLEDSDLNTLVMGRFSTGKSVFLNALMGADVLPSDVRPCTAVIGEISHGKNWGVTLHARDSKLQPVHIQIHQLKEYITIPHDTQDKQNIYAKVEIQAPIQVFENGVRFVDSPGLDDPTSHDEVTTTYLPKADAIVYIMNCNSIYSKSDKVMIDELRTLGHSSIIFVLTFFDQLEMNDMMYGTDDAEKCRQYCLQKLSHLTDLGESGIFFVNSRAALKGKIDGNDELLSRSHFSGMEVKLEQILAAEKGRMKLGKVFSDVFFINKKCDDFFNGIIQLSTQQRGELKRNVERAKIPLQEAEKKAELIYETVRSQGEKFMKRLSVLAEKYYSRLITSVQSWVLSETELPCENKIKLLKPKESTTKFINELLSQLKVRMQQDLREWGDTELNDEFKSFIDTLSVRVDREVSACIAIVEDVKDILLNVNKDEMVDSSTVGSGERVVAAGLAMLLGDIYGATMGGVSGFSGMIRTITCEVVTGIVLVVASLFTPIGLPAFIIGAILSALAGGAWTASTLEPKARKKVAEQFVANLNKTETKEEFLSGLNKSVSNMLGELSDSISKHVSEPINQARKLLEDAEQAFSTQGTELKTKADAYTAYIAQNAQITNSLNEFEREYLK